MNTESPLSSGAHRALQKGFTLVELMLVLVVAAIILIGIYAAYRLVFSGTNVQSASQNAVIMEGKISGIYRSAQTGYTGLNELAAIQANAVPSTYFTNNCTTATPACLKSEWGTPIGIQPAVFSTAVAGVSNAFQITYIQVPKSDCPEFVTSALSQFAGVVITTASSGTTEPPAQTLTSTNNAATGGTSASLPAIVKNASVVTVTNQISDPATIAGACSKAGTVDIALIAR